MGQPPPPPPRPAVFQSLIHQGGFATPWRVNGWATSRITFQSLIHQGGFATARIGPRNGDG